MSLDRIERCLRRCNLRRYRIERRSAVCRRSAAGPRKFRLHHELCIYNTVLLVADLPQDTGNHLRTLFPAVARPAEAAFLCAQRIHPGTVCVDLGCIGRFCTLRCDGLLRTQRTCLLSSREGNADRSEAVLRRTEILPGAHKVCCGILLCGARFRKIALRRSEIRLCLRERIQRRMIGADLALHIRHIGKVPVHIMQRIVTCRRSIVRQSAKSERTGRRAPAQQDAAAQLSQHTHAFSILSRSGSASP